MAQVSYSDVVEGGPRAAQCLARPVIYPRSNSIVSRSGKRIVKNPARVEHGCGAVGPGQGKVPLFRLNSFVKDAGRQEEEDDEPERQQWDRWAGR